MLPFMSEKSDPTKDPEFQKVIRHFVTTPHKPHEPIGKTKTEKQEKANQSKGNDDGRRTRRSD
jgi:hypothetical protein